MEDHKDFKYSKACVLLFSLFLSGCSYPMISYQGIKQAAAQVDSSNGVSQREAVLLAQNNIISKGLGERLYTLKPFKVRKKIFYFDEGEEVEFVRPPRSTFGLEVHESWEVYFRDKKNSFFRGRYPVIPFMVEVNSHTGEILDWGLKR